MTITVELKELRDYETALREHFGARCTEAFKYMATQPLSYSSMPRDLDGLHKFLASWDAAHPVPRLIPTV